MGSKTAREPTGRPPHVRDGPESAAPPADGRFQGAKSGDPAQMARPRRHPPHGIRNVPPARDGHQGPGPAFRRDPCDPLRPGPRPRRLGRGPSLEGTEITALRLPRAALDQKAHPRLGLPHPEPPRRVLGPRRLREARRFGALRPVQALLRKTHPSLRRSENRGKRRRRRRRRRRPTDPFANANARRRTRRRGPRSRWRRGNRRRGPRRSVASWSKRDGGPARFEAGVRVAAAAGGRRPAARAGRTRVGLAAADGLARPLPSEPDADGAVPGVRGQLFRKRRERRRRAGGLPYDAGHREPPGHRPQGPPRRGKGLRGLRRRRHFKQRRPRSGPRRRA
mmetsp:Transcript_34315/g.110198  ORF Transcript_34315/g.110198 Transcript_34315/m.110198 type:complete len:337 (-) Transcript_34315:347-1357(-)